MSACHDTLPCILPSHISSNHAWYPHILKCLAPYSHTLKGTIENWGPEDSYVAARLIGCVCSLTLTYTRQWYASWQHTNRACLLFYTHVHVSAHLQLSDTHIHKAIICLMMTPYQCYASSCQWRHIVACRINVESERVRERESAVACRINGVADLRVWVRLLCWGCHSDRSRRECIGALVLPYPLLLALCVCVCVCV